MLLAELGGVELRRGDLHLAVQEVAGALVMDSKGIFDAMTRNMSSLHGLRDSRAGYELTLAVSQAVKAKTQLKWVTGEWQRPIGRCADKVWSAEDLASFLRTATALAGSKVRGWQEGP